MTDIYVLCGGAGTRIKSLGFGVPKPLIPFPRDSKITVIEQILFRLSLAGVTSATLVVTHANKQFFLDRQI